MEKPDEFLGKKILLVEDVAVLALLNEKILVRSGYEVTVATDGEKAVKLALARRDFDLILMDIDLGPGIDGTLAAQRILEQFDVPILFLSSHTEPEVVEKTEQITNYGYVVKNSSPTVLLASIKMAFKLHNSLSALQEAENLITKERDNLLAILDGSPIAMMLIRDDLRILQANPLAARYCSYNPVDPSETHLSQDFSPLESEVQSCLESGKPLAAQEFTLRTHNSRSYFRYTVSPVHRDRFSGRLGLLTIEDVTTIRDEHERILTLSHIADNPGSIVLITDKDRRIEWANKAFTELTEYTLEEIRGLQPGKLLQGSQPDILQNKEISTKLNKGESYACELLNYKKSGQPYWISLNIQPVLDSTGKIKQYISIEHEITQRKTTEKRLQDQRDKTYKVMNQMSQGLLILGADGKPTYLNPAYQRMFQQRKDGTVVEIADIPESLHPDERSRLLALIYGAIEAKAPGARYVYRYLNPDNQYVWREDRTIFFYNDQGVLEESFIFAQVISLFEPREIFFEIEGLGGNES